MAIGKKQIEAKWVEQIEATKNINKSLPGLVPKSILIVNQGTFAFIAFPRLSG